MRTIWQLCIVALLSVTPTMLSGQQPLSRAALNGEWTGVLVLDNSQPRISLVFALTDSTFEGKVYSDATLMGPMERGSFDGNRIHFTLGRLDFTGVVDGPRMKVDLIVYNGSTRTFVLTKTP